MCQASNEYMSQAKNFPPGGRQLLQMWGKGFKVLSPAGKLCKCYQVMPSSDAFLELLHNTAYVTIPPDPAAVR